MAREGEGGHIPRAGGKRKVERSMMPDPFRVLAVGFIAWFLGGRVGS